MTSMGFLWLTQQLSAFHSHLSLYLLFSYLCDDWVLNDTPNGDIRLIQSMLGQIASQNYKESVTRSGHIIRPASLFTRMDSK